MKNSFTTLFSILISIYSIGCDSSNSPTNSSDCPFLNQSRGCDGNCSQNPLIDDACGICGGDGSSCENESNCPINQSIGCDSNCAENPLQNDACGICGGDGSTCENLWNVFYDVDVPIAGFQFGVNEGSIINASGGATIEAGLSVSKSSSTVLAFSFSGATIPSGTGILISLEIEGDSNLFCIKDLVLSNIDGESIPAIIENCNTIKYSE